MMFAIPITMTTIRGGPGADLNARGDAGLDSSDTASYLNKQNTFLVCSYSNVKRKKKEINSQLTFTKCLPHKHQCNCCSSCLRIAESYRNVTVT